MHNQQAVTFFFLVSRWCCSSQDEPQTGGQAWPHTIRPLQVGVCLSEPSAWQMSTLWPLVRLQIRRHWGEHTSVYSRRVWNASEGFSEASRLRRTQSPLEPSVLQKHNLEDTTGDCAKQISSVRKFCFRHWEKQDSCWEVCGEPLLQLVLAWEISSFFFCLVRKGGKSLTHCLLLCRREREKN